MIKFGLAAAVTQGPLSRPYAVPLPWVALEPSNKGYLWAGRAWASPAPQALTFIDRAGASPAPSPSLLSTGQGPPNPSLLSTGTGQPGPQPLTSIGQTPHFYQPGSAAAWPQTRPFPWTDAP